eukprot:5155702-Pleurochrysis_carterae.AAC.1
MRRVLVSQLYQRRVLVSFRAASLSWWLARVSEIDILFRIYIKVCHPDGMNLFELCVNRMSVLQHASPCVGRRPCVPLVV